jgi:hypothetical protein
LKHHRLLLFSECEKTQKRLQKLLIDSKAENLSVQGDDKFEKVVAFNKQLRQFKKIHDRNKVLCQESLPELSSEEEGEGGGRGAIDRPLTSSFLNQEEKAGGSSSRLRQGQKEEERGNISTNSCAQASESKLVFQQKCKVDSKTSKLSREPENSETHTEKQSVMRAIIETTFPVESDSPVQNIGLSSFFPQKSSRYNGKQIPVTASSTEICGPVQIIINNPEPEFVNTSKDNNIEKFSDPQSPAQIRQLFPSIRNDITQSDIDPGPDPHLLGQKQEQHSHQEICPRNSVSKINNQKSPPAQKLNKLEERKEKDSVTNPTKTESMSESILSKESSNIFDSKRVTKVFSSESGKIGSRTGHLDPHEKISAYCEPSAKSGLYVQTLEPKSEDKGKNQADPFHSLPKDKSASNVDINSKDTVTPLAKESSLYKAKILGPGNSFNEAIPIQKEINRFKKSLVGTDKYIEMERKSYKAEVDFASSSLDTEEIFSRTRSNHHDAERRDIVSLNSEELNQSHIRSGIASQFESASKTSFRRG